MALSIRTTSRDSIAAFETLSYKERLEYSYTTIKKIQLFAKDKFPRIFFPMMKNWVEQFKHQSYIVSALKILSSPVYLVLLGLGTLTSYAGGNLLYTANFSAALSSDVDVRVNFANNITNAGAIFACLTDLPAITYCYWLFVLNDAYRKAVHKALDESYQSCVNDLNLPEKMREEIYLQYVSLLKHSGIEQYYLNPDLETETGKVYQELASLLEEIDKKLNQEMPIRDLIKSSFQAFKQESWIKKIAKIAGVAGCLCVDAFSTFIILENTILVKDTPVSDLFTGNSTEQNNEAFYLTQLGGFFSSLTAIGASAWAKFLLFLATGYKNERRKKIETCFDACAPKLQALSEAARNEFYQIKQLKLMNVK